VPTPSLDEARRKGLLNPLGVPIENRYLAELRRLALHPELSTQARAVSIVYTPLHGVGGKLGPQALAQAGFSRVFPVEAQLEPDPRFPTVRYPNPEEKGALDLSLALAREKDADLVLANDPDADRLAVAVRKGPGEHVQLTGDQVGALLGYYLLTEGKGGAERLVVSTVVSSPLLRYMAAELGAHYAETLTGFKWIANRAMALESERKLVLTFAYEEALGYAVCRAVRDKDGLSAAVVFAELAAFCRSRSSSVLEYLETIYRRFGLFKTAQRSVTLPGASGAAEIRAIMERLRASPLKSIGPVRVAATRDLLHGSELPSANVMAWDLEGGGRIVARPSGTEPKIKYYFELRETPGESEELPPAKVRGERRLLALVTDFVRLAVERGQPG
jgi:phosphomannomutase